MTPIPYVPELHFEQVKLWSQTWDEDLQPEALPQTGFIIPGKAAGFLYRTDSAAALIEGLIAAPGLGREERDKAVDAIVTAICLEAQKLGFKVLLGYSPLDAVVERAKRFGFIVAEETFRMVALKL